MFEAAGPILPIADERAGARRLCDVVVLNDFAHVQGGGSKVAVSSAAALAARGHRVVFFAAVGPADPLLARHDVALVCLDQHDILSDPSRLRAAGRGLWNAAAAAALRDVLASLDPARTVVHVHGWMKALSSSVVRCALDAGFPTVSTLHDYSAVCPNGGFFDYPAERICRRLPLGAACLARNCDQRSYGHKLWRVARQIVQQRMGGLPGRLRDFIVLSETDRRLHRGLLADAARLHFVRNPIDVACAPPVSPARNAAFTAIGRLAREKGPVPFAKAAREAGVPAVFVGDGYLRQEIAAAAPQAEVTGWLDADGVLSRIDRARVLVFPSLWPETQGLAVLEAAARGVPALVSDACAAQESIVPERTGLLFRAGDAADLVRQLRRLRDDDLVTELGRNAYERFWADPPTLDAHADALAAVYRGMLAAREVGNA